MKNDMEPKSVVPYNNGKIKIGVFYRPECRAVNNEPFMNTLQDMLLGKTTQHTSWFKRMLDKLKEKVAG
jgi:hypothetical protein